MPTGANVFPSFSDPNADQADSKRTDCMGSGEKQKAPQNQLHALLVVEGTGFDQSPKEQANRAFRQTRVTQFVTQFWPVGRGWCPVRKLTIPEFHAELKSQGVGRREDLAFVCPMCATVQSGADWVAATGKPFEDIEGQLAFSCIGRATGAGEYKRGAAPGGGCNWTLGGFLKIHALEIVDEDGKGHPRFELASPDLAQQHARLRSQAGAA